MGLDPQMFFVRDCAEILPAWLKAPVPGLHFLDSSISFLSVLDCNVFQWRRMGGEVDEQDVQYESAADYEDESFDWDEAEEDFDEFEADENESADEEDQGEQSRAAAPEAAPAVSGGGVSFYIEGEVGFGIRFRYAIKGQEFCVDENTIVSGELMHGGYAAVQGYIDGSGVGRATIIVTDAYHLH